MTTTEIFLSFMLYPLVMALMVLYFVMIFVCLLVRFLCKVFADIWMQKMNVLGIFDFTERELFEYFAGLKDKR